MKLRSDFMFNFYGIDHVQLAAPEGCEQAARHFFTTILGWEELEKPEPLKPRGGVWFQCGTQQVHIGVQKDFVAAKKAHPAFRVKHLNALKAHLISHKIEIIDDEARHDEGIIRFYIFDSFGNRLEFLEYV